MRKRVEEIFGWMKTVGGFRRTRYRGLDRTGLAGYLVATAYNLVRMTKPLAPTQEAPAIQNTCPSQGALCQADPDRGSRGR